MFWHPNTNSSRDHNNVHSHPRVYTQNPNLLLHTASAALTFHGETNAEIRTNGRHTLISFFSGG